MQHAEHIAGESQKKPRAGRRFEPGVSGNIVGGRLHAKRAAELHARMVPDFPQLSGVDDTMLRQACNLLARAQSPKVEPELAVRLTGTAHRVIAALQRRYKSVPKPTAPPLSEYLASLAARDGAERAAELAADEISEMAPSSGVSETEGGGS
jgi:hypothetical protein